VILIDEAFSKVTVVMQIRGKYTLCTEYFLSEIHVTPLWDAGVALCDDLQWCVHRKAIPGYAA
jgi:hypothetical protein